MKRILLRSGKSPFDVLSAEESIERDVLGTNAGNLIFSDAAHKILSTPDAEVFSNGLGAYRGLADKVNEYDAFVIPLANAFRPRFGPALERLTRVIRKVNVPVVVLGVGAQADVDGDVSALAAVEAEVRDFVSAVLDHGPSIGVRGEFTADYLTSLGFKDVEVIGCPSMFFDGPSLPATRPVDELTADSLVAINGSHTAIGSLGLDRLIARIHEQFPRAVFFGQNTVEAAQLRWRDVSTPAGVVTRMPTHPDNVMYREGNVRVHVDPTTWIDELRSFDFSIGARIHGSIAGILAGTPTVVLCGDSRTLELCRYFEIPHQLLRSLPQDADPVAIFEQADWAPMHAGHGERFTRFTDYLDAHGLENTFTHGDGGRAFDDRIAGLEFPSGIRPSHLSDLDAALEHVAWLRQHAKEARRREHVRQTREVKARAAKASVPAPAPQSGRAARLFGRGGR